MSTITLTLEVSDDLAALLAEPGNRAEAAAALAAHFGTSLGDKDEDPNAWYDDLTPEEREEHLAGLRASIARADAGNLTPVDVVHQRIREKYGAR